MVVSSGVTAESAQGCAGVAEKVWEHGFLFTGQMVRAILAGKKTQTRRIMTPHNSVCGSVPSTKAWWSSFAFDGIDGRQCFPDELMLGPSNGYLSAPLKPTPMVVEHGAEGTRHRIGCRVQAGERIWVRETWAPMCRVADPYCWCDDESKAQNHYTEYRADTDNAKYPGDWPDETDPEEDGLPRWRSSLLMPRNRSRILLEVERVRPERLLAISEDDARAEGFSGREEFLAYFHALNDKRTGAPENPWVWVYQFKCIDPAHAEARTLRVAEKTAC